MPRLAVQYDKGVRISINTSFHCRSKSAKHDYEQHLLWPKRVNCTPFLQANGSCNRARFYETKVSFSHGYFDVSFMSVEQI